MNKETEFKSKSSHLWQPIHVPRACDNEGKKKTAFNIPSHTGFPFNDHLSHIITCLSLVSLIKHRR